MHKADGYTFLELLIVLAILMILIGLVALSLLRVVPSVRGTLMDAEREVVQAAMDLYMIHDVGAEGVSSGIPAQPQPVRPAPGGPFTFGKYLRSETHFSYTWDADGENVQVH